MVDSYSHHVLYSSPTLCRSRITLYPTLSQIPTMFAHLLLRVCTRWLTSHANTHTPPPPHTRTHIHAHNRRRCRHTCARTHVHTRTLLRVRVRSLCCQQRKKIPEDVLKHDQVSLVTDPIPYVRKLIHSLTHTHTHMYVSTRRKLGYFDHHSHPVLNFTVNTCTTLTPHHRNYTADRTQPINLFTDYTHGTFTYLCSNTLSFSY